MASDINPSISGMIDGLQERKPGSRPHHWGCPETGPSMTSTVLPSAFRSPPCLACTVPALVFEDFLKCGVGSPLWALLIRDINPMLFGLGCFQSWINIFCKQGKKSQEGCWRRFNWELERSHRIMQWLLSPGQRAASHTPGLAVPSHLLDCGVQNCGHQRHLGWTLQSIAFFLKSRIEFSSVLFCRLWPEIFWMVGLDFTFWAAVRKDPAKATAQSPALGHGLCWSVDSLPPRDFFCTLAPAQADVPIVSQGSGRMFRAQPL